MKHPFGIPLALAAAVSLAACGGAAPASPAPSSAPASPASPSPSSAAASPGASAAAAKPSAASNAASTAGKPSPAGSAAASPSASGRLVDISYAVPSTEDANLLPQNVAKKMGFFANHGLNADIILVQGGPNAIAAIQANSVAAGVTSTPLLFNALGQGAQVVAVAEEVEGFSMQLIVSSKLARDRNMTLTTSTDTMLEYAKGLRIGGQAPGATPTAMFQGVIKTAGKPADWTQPGNTGTTTASLAALQNGVVDAIIGSPPSGQIAEAGGYGKIVWNSLSIEQFRALAYGITLMNPSWADSHQQVAEGMVAALDDAQRWIQANPEPAAQLASTLFPNLPSGQMASILKDMNYAKSARITEASMKAAQSLANTFSLTTNPVSDELTAKAYTSKYFKS